MADSASFALKLKDQFSANAKKASATLGLFNKRASSAGESSRGFSKGIASVRSSMHGLSETQGQAAKSAESYLGSMLKFEALKSGARAVLGLGSAIFETAAFTDQMTMAFGQLSHERSGAETLQHTRRMAEMLGLDVDGTTKAYKNFLALQFKPGMADKLLMMGADMQALGTDADQVQGIFLALGQIKSKGRVQAEELLQLNERGFAVELVQDEGAKVIGLIDEAKLKALQDTGQTSAANDLLKKGRQDLQKMQEAGKFGADDFFTAFGRAINRKLGQSEVGQTGKKWAETTFGGMVAVFKAKATSLWKGLVERGAMDGLFNTIKGAADQFEKFVVSPEGAATIRGLTSAIQTMFSVASSSIPWIFTGFRKAANAWAWAGDHAAPLLAAGLVLVTPAAWSAAAAGWGMAAGWVAATWPLLLAAAAVGTLVWVFTESLKVDWAFLGTKIAEGASELWAGIKSAGTAMLTWAKDIGVNIVNGIVSGIKSMAGSVWSAAKSLAGGVLGGTEKELDINSPSKKMAKLGVYTGRGFTDGYAASMLKANDVMPAWSSSLSPANDISPEFGSGVAAADFSGMSVGGGRGPVPRIEINITIQGGSSTAEEIAREVGQSVRDQIEDVFRDYADEAAA